MTNVIDKRGGTSQDFPREGKSAGAGYSIEDVEKEAAEVLGHGWGNLEVHIENHRIVQIDLLKKKRKH